VGDEPARAHADRRDHVLAGAVNHDFDDARRRVANRVLLVELVLER
jgi:hypothetical protein